jgi:CBS domain-containing protein
MLREKVGCLPVVNDGSVLVGIVTEFDLLEVLVREEQPPQSAWRL